ncbi:hypothetical protein, partial [Iodidimonas gelatinilytica]
MTKTIRSYSDLSPRDLAQVVEDGVLKSLAPRFYGDDDLTKEYFSISEERHKYIKNKFESPNVHDYTKDIGIINILRGTNLTPYCENYWDLDRQIKLQALSRIRSKEWIAVGFMSPRHANDIPQPAPFDYWKDIQCFKNDILKLGTLKMEAVHILPARLLYIEGQSARKINVTPQGTTASIPETGETNKPKRGGPDSKMALIVAAYKTLVQQGTITPSDGNSLLAYHVRECILDNN